MYVYVCVCVCVCVCMCVCVYVCVLHCRWWVEKYSTGMKDEKGGERGRTSIRISLGLMYFICLCVCQYVSVNDDIIQVN